MARVLQHLEKMGAQINYIDKAGLAPFTIRGGNLEGKEFKLKVASAQVQTAILLAGLQATVKQQYIYLAMPATIQRVCSVIWVFLLKMIMVL